MDVALIQVPYDSGRRDERMGRGPGHLADAGAGERAQAAMGGGKLRSARIETDLTFATEATCAFDLARKLSSEVALARRHGAFPLVLAGNCMSSVGTVAGLSEIDRVGVVWFDAHGDLNTPETSPEGFLDGMAAAVLTGRCWQGPVHQVPGYQPLPDDRLLHVGARDLDPSEAQLLDSGTVPRVDGRTLADRGAEALAAPLDALARRVDAVHLHLDLDVHDAEAVRFNPFAAPGGPSPEQVRACLEAVTARIPIAAAALTAYAPELDHDGRAAEVALAHLETVIAGVARR